MAGVPLWLVGAVIGVVVLVALLIFVVMIRCLSPWIRCHLTFMFDTLRQGWFWSSLTSLLFRKRRAAEKGEQVPTEAGWTLQEA